MSYRLMGALGCVALDEIEQDVEREVLAAVEFAEASPEPDPADLFEFSYATPVANQPASVPGRQP
jgi:pyruvate dehydrogenase E1 component alpha subunit